MNTPAKTILITGCSSGIGYATAIMLRGEDYRVIASARKAEDVQRLQAEGFEAVQLDLADSESIQQAVQQVVALTGGKLDALFNNGAFGQPGAVEDLRRDVLRQQFETNVFGTQELTNLVIPLMRKQGRGCIIYNSSVLGLVAMKYRGAYNASKYALEGLADTLRLELYNTGIDIVLIEPGPIYSAFRKNAFKLFQQNIDTQHSAHKAVYAALTAKLQKEGAVVPFTLPPEAVAEKVLKALRAKRPQIRYYVTFPTYLFGYLRRLLPARVLDRILMQVK
jgi:NAD(P)-dependent dehydrogenase (short-subunit alcohol dehydrogenase family)